MSVKIGLVGTGTVGGGCLDILKAHRKSFARHYGVDLELVRVCSRNPEQAIAHEVEDIFTQDYREIVADPDIDIVIELIGGTTVAKDVVCEALRAGKNVVTANKALMASAGEEVEALAAEAGKQIAYEASVGGGIPIITPLKTSLAANEISSVMGIVNGTTNYMLTRMNDDGLTYDDALAEAQEKGFAEADPTADVDGFDAAAKIAILASLAYNTRVTLDDVPAEGIRTISPLDLEAAEDMGYCIKLLAHAHRVNEGIDVRVHPTMLPLDHPLATVNGVFNAIYVVGDAVGETMFFGEGAGAGPAASAVMGDVIEVARTVQAGTKPLPEPSYDEKANLIPMDELKTQYYLRFKVLDRSGVLAATAEVFAKHGVSISSMVQRGAKQGDAVNLVYVTHLAQEKNVRAVIDDIAKLDGVLIEGAQHSVIRVAE